MCCIEPVQIFDCIEFNHRFRFGDVAGEIAFLAMDLERLGRPDLAIRFLNAYLEETGDYEAVPLLDFYRAYRAWVRGKVLSFLVADHPERAAEARALFALAARFAKPERRARLFVTTGVMGTGKSTAARLVAARLGAIVIRTDAVSKRLAGQPLRERAAAAYGEGLYTAEMCRRTYAEALRLAGELLRAGWPVIVDGAFPTPRSGPRRARSPDRHGAPFTVLWCDAPDEVLVERLRSRSERPARGLGWARGASGSASRALRAAGRGAGRDPRRHHRRQRAVVEAALRELEARAAAMDRRPRGTSARDARRPSLHVPRDGPPERRRGEDARLVRGSG